MDNYIDKTKADLIAEIERLEKLNNILEVKNSGSLLEKIADNYPNSFVSIIEKDLSIGFTSGQEFIKQGLDPNAFIGLSLEQVFAEHTPLVKENYLKTFAGKETSFELFINGQYQLYKAVPIKEEDGEINKILVVVENVSKNRLIEKELAESKKRFQLMFENHNAIMLLIEPDSGKILNANMSSEKFYGYSISELCSMSINDINCLSPEQISAESIKAKKMKRNYFIFSHKLKNGEVRNVEVHSTPIKQNNKTILFSIIHDITERKLAEISLLESEDKFRVLYNNSPDMYVSVSPDDATILLCNNTLLKNLDYSREEVIGAPIFKMYHDDCMEDVKGAFQQYVNTGEVKNRELILKRKDGSKLDVSLNVFAVRNTTGKILYSMSTWRDITEKKQSDKALQDSEDKFKKIFELSPIMMALTDPESQVFLNVNNTWLRQLGFTREEVVGKKSADLNIFLDSSARDELIRLITDQGFISNHEFQLRKKSGSIFHCIFSIHFVELNEKKLMLTTAVDITERKQAEEALIQNETRLKNMFESMSEGFSIQDVICDDEGNPIDLRFVDANPAFEKQTGLINSKTLGHTLLELFPTSEKLWVERYGKVGITGESISFEAMFGPLNIYYHVNAFQTAPRQFGVLFTDINERKLHEIELAKSKEKVEESEKYLMYSQKLAKLGHWKLIPETLEVIGSEELLNIFEIETGKLTIDSFMAVVHPEDTARNTETIERGIREGKLWDIEHRLLFENGHIKWIRTIGEPFLDKNNKVTQIDGIAQDITERKEAEKAIKESEEKFRGIYEQSPIAIEIYDRNGKLIDVNQKTLEMFGVDDKKHVLGFDLWADPNLSSEKTQSLKNGKAIFLSAEFDFDIVKNLNLYPTSRSGLMYMDMYAIPLMEKNDISGFLVQIVEITERKKLEEDRNKNQALLQQAEEISNYGAWEWDIGKDKWTFSQNWLRIHGCQLSGIKREELMTITYPDDNQLVEKAFQDALNGDADYNLEHRIVRQNDGKVRYVRAVGDFIYNDSGQRVKMYGVAQDITDRIQAEKAIKDSEYKYRLLIQNLPQRIFSKDRNHRYITCSENFARDLNLTKEDLIGKTDFELFPNELAEKYQQDDIRIMKSGQTEELDEEYFNQGQKRIVHTVKTPMNDENGEVVGVMGIFWDVTDKRKAIEQIRFQANLLETVEQAVIVTNQDGIINYWNPYAEKLYGWSAAEVIGRVIVEITVPQLSQDQATEIMAQIGEGKSWSGEFLVQKRDGTVFPAFVSNTPIVNEKGELTDIIGISTDITDRKEAENELYESLQREQLQANIVRNSPLAIAFGYPDGRLENCNKAFSDLTGYTEEELKTISWNEVLTPAKWKDIEAKELQKLSVDNNSIQYEKEYKHKTGKIIPIELVVSAEFDDHKNIVHFIGFIIDITERKQFLKKLQERNDYIEAIMENMPIGFALNSIDDGSVKYLNNRFEEIYGWPREVLTNTSIFFEKVFPDPEYREKMTTQIITDMQSGDPTRMVWKDLKIVTSTGEERYVYAYNIPLPDQNLMISTVQDTSTRKLAEDELTKYREHLEELVKERTKDLEDKNEELEKFNDLFVDREIRIKELRNEIEKFKNNAKQ